MLIKELSNPTYINLISQARHELGLPGLFSERESNAIKRLIEIGVIDREIKHLTKEFRKAFDDAMQGAASNNPSENEIRKMIWSHSDWYRGECDV